jgi:hypothetical protein
MVYGTELLSVPVARTYASNVPVLGLAYTPSRLSWVRVPLSCTLPTLLFRADRRPSRAGPARQSASE